MPFAQIHVTEGHSAEQKRVLIEKVTQAIQDAVGAPRPNVRVWIHALPTTDYGIGGSPVAELDYNNAPFAQLFLMEGRTEEQLRNLIALVCQALVEALDAPMDKVRAWITEVPKSNWGIAGKTAKDLGR